MSLRELSWSGPYALVQKPGRAVVYEAEEAGTSGVYLWAIHHENRYLVNYVGESGTSVAERLREHVEQWLTGQSCVYAPDGLHRGEKHEVFLPGKAQNNFVEFIKQSRTMLAITLEQLECFDVFFAPVVNDEHADEMTFHKTLTSVASALIRAFRDEPKANWFLDNEQRCLDTGGNRLVPIAGSERFVGMPTVIRL